MRCLLWLVMIAFLPRAASGASCDEKFEIFEEIGTIANGQKCRAAPVGNWFGCEYSNGEKFLFNIQSNRQIPMREVAKSRFSPDGKVVAYSDLDDRIHLIQLDTGKESLLPGSDYFAFAADSKSLVFNRKESIKRHEISTGQTTDLTRKFKLPEISDPLFTRDGNHLIGMEDDLTVVSADLTTGKFFTFEGNRPRRESFSISDDGSTYIDRLGIAVRNGQAIWGNSPIQVAPSGTVIRSQNNELQTLEFGFDGSPWRRDHRLDETPREFTWSTEGTQANFVTYSKVGILELGSRKITTWSIPSTHFGCDLEGDDPDTLVIEDCRQAGAGALYFDFKDPGFRAMPGVPRATPAGKNLFLTATEAGTVIRQLKTHCLDDSTVVLEDPLHDCADCAPEKPFRSEGGVIALASAVGSLIPPSLPERCSELWEKKHWPEIETISAKNKIEPREAEILLQAWSKPGAFQVGRHLNALGAIARSSLPLQQPDLFLDALSAIAASKSSLVHALLEQLPHLRELKPQRPPAKSCRSPHEEGAVQSAAAELIQRYAKEMQANGTLFADWAARLAPYRSVLPRMSAPLKEELRDLVAQSIADRAMATDYRAHFASRVYYYCYHAVADLFGETSKNVSEVAIARERDSIQPIIISSRPIDDKADTRTPYGFYAKSLPQLHRSSLPYEQKVHWTAGEKILHSRIKIAVKESGAAKIPQGNAPKYDELWKDGSLNGLVMTGASFHRDAETLNYYLAYYQNQGFTFEDRDKTVPNLPVFLESEITSGHADYFIKEAHSDGDDSNIFSMFRKGRAKIGVKKHPDGRTERITLVYPDKDSSDILVSNRNFGSWINERSRSGHGQFVYLNMSCNSYRKAMNEIETTNDPTLLDIATGSVAWGFQFHNDSALLRLVHGLRRGFNYEQLRSYTRDTTAYKQYKKDTYLFPDDPQYKSWITDNLSVTYDIDTQIQDERGETYAPTHH